MERLYTEAEWRAIAELEERADAWMGIECEKRIVGWSFGGGEFYLAGQPVSINPKHFGPQNFSWFVYEKTSRTRITWNADTKADALSGARHRLTNAPEDHVARIFAERREDAAKEEAARAIRIAQSRKPKGPRKIGKRLREIFAADNGKCHYCKTELELTGTWEVDHRMPKALGGGDGRINLVAACRPCNRLKRDKTDVEFLALLASKQATE